MRFALLSDLHANRQALTAVLSDIQATGADELICLGDVVGYGPAPAEVLALAHARIHHFILGNHDAVIAGQLQSDLFNDDARTIIEWTAKQLDRKAAAFLAAQPLAVQGKSFRCVHGEYTSPPAFQYLFSEEDALANWNACPDPFLFVGHTHVPGLFVLGKSGVPHALPPQDFAAEEGKRYIVNVGSVGQPRDGDVRASWVLFDDDAQTVQFRRVPFDVDAYREELARAGIPARPSHFLLVADRQQPPPLREMLDFRPARPASGPAAAYRVKDLEQVLRTARRWQRAAGVLLVLFTLACLFAGWLFAKTPKKETVYPARDPAPLSALAVAPNSPLLDDLDVLGRIGPETRLRRWSVALTDPRYQEVTIALDDADAAGRNEPIPCFLLNSRQPLPLRLLASPVPGQAGARFTVAAQFKTAAVTGGWIRVDLVETLTDGNEKLIQQKELQHLGSERWEQLRFTLEKKGGGLRAPGLLRFVIHGQFTGEVRVRKCRLELCE